MKNPKNFLLALIAIFIFSGCEEVPNPGCIKAKVIGYQSCYNVNIVQILSGPVKGRELDWYEQKYDNVVQFTGAVIPKDEIIYINYSLYGTDEKPEYQSQICPSNTFPVPVPYVKLNDYSTIKCP
ncbi:hypothetical protein KZP23_17665 [Echinicola marina]|uniref:hypothetical protein n=1 Tax=Echinicola marina TaxID=2859768 RepID=UPI001CF6384F|nr:hypothetical protein [Echinicola marina]UCS92504.1 hypothetical protein KZP23_17665 [Echinicola marina]